jgi:hypothetical protein
MTFRGLTVRGLTTTLHYGRLHEQQIKARIRMYGAA